MEKETKRHSVKRRTLVVILVTAMIILAAAVIGLLVLSDWERRYEALNEQMQQIAQRTMEPSPTGQPEITETASQAPNVPIDFAALRTQNQDIYAWITVPGTDVDYPIVQNPLDDSFYLTHNLAGQESVEGAIYTERFNSKDFTDPNTVIYGHNMKNGSMFAGLHQYEDKAFFDENREIVVYTPEKKLTYRIFAAYASGNEHIMQAYDFTDQSVFTRYLDGIFNIRDMKANIDSGMTVTDRDKILTLSTCVKGQDEKRYLVQAVLETDE